MKILKKGKKNPNKPWIGYKAECLNCECRFQLEATDKVRFYPDQRDGDYYETRCPECKNSVTIQADLVR